MAAANPKRETKPAGPGQKQANPAEAAEQESHFPPVETPEEPRRETKASKRAASKAKERKPYFSV